MKKLYFLISLVVVLILAVNVYYYYFIYNQQVGFHKDMLSKQTQICGWEIEQSGYEFENEINYIVYSTDLSKFFDLDDQQYNRIKKLELFYFKYQNLIVNIKLIDKNKNVFSLFKDKTNHFISDYYQSQRQRKLLDRENVEKNIDGTYTYILPVFIDSEPILNILIKVDVRKYVNNIFNNYYLGSTLWQWLVDYDGNMITNNLSRDSIHFNQMDRLLEDLNKGNSDFLHHKFEINGESSDIISSYYPVRILSKDFGVVFSMKTDIIISSVIKSAIIVGSSSLIIMIFIIFFFLFYIRKMSSREQILKESATALEQIIEAMPIGVMILTKEKIVKSLNKTAQKIFGLQNENELKGKEISSQFLISRNFTDQESFSYTDNLNQYVYYDDNDNEIIIYKKEIPFFYDEEEVSLEAFIDITPIEKARKREVAANKAKSEFLAKMSHEIRTPLNGIIGMADTLASLKLTSKQEDALHIIKKSADLLLSIINDILDFSKIEAGKMILEETPFELREEIESTISLFQPKAKEKGLQLFSEISGDVPDELIGDPFRLRQVISNLIGNAIKFTFEGKIALTVELVRRTSGVITILFNLEDTGIGIPKEKLKEIFRSFSQADGSTTRKFGGTGLGITISKQLVELMNGEMWVESPSSISTDPQYRGSRFSFTIQVYSNEKLHKDIDVSHITNYDQINVLIINKNPEEENTLFLTFKNFETNVKQITPQEDPIKEIKSKSSDSIKKYHLIIIKDSAVYDGMSLARQLHEEGITENYLMGIVSSNDQPGNYVKCRMHGIDYYLIKPYEASEVFEIIQDNFTNLTVSDKKLPELNKIKENINILVAEDNIINQKVAQTIFKNLGYEITLVQNGKECVKIIKENKYDIIFMDIMMPEKDGLEATAEIRSLGYTLPIVAMTANAREEDKMRALNSGMNEYLPKPVKIEEIKEVLIKWFSESQN